MDIEEIVYDICILRDEIKRIIKTGDLHNNLLVVDINNVIESANKISDIEIEQIDV